MTATDGTISVPEAARRLGLAGGDVYRLLFRGELAGGPARDGAVYVSAASIEQYLRQQASREPSTG